MIVKIFNFHQLLQAIMNRDGQFPLTLLNLYLSIDITRCKLNYYVRCGKTLLEIDTWRENIMFLVWWRHEN